MTTPQQNLPYYGTPPSAVALPVAGVPTYDDWGSPLSKSGESTVNRRAASSAYLLTSGLLCVAYFRASRTEVVSKIAQYNTVIAAATPTLARMGVYAVDFDANTASLIAATANDTTLYNVANAKNERNFTAPWLKTAGQVYGVASLVVSGVAPPTLMCGLVGVAISVPDNGYYSGGALGSQSDLPASFVPTSLAALNPIIYSTLKP